MSTRSVRRTPHVIVIENRETSSGPPSNGVSPYAARVLDQLSLTSWLPAGFLVANLGVVIGLHLAKTSPESPRAGITAVARSLDSKPLGVLVALVLGVLLVVIATQSFEFSAIRMLEGYWGPGFLASLLAGFGIWLQQLRLQHLERAGEKCLRKAYHSISDVLNADYLSEREQQAARDLQMAVRRVADNHPVGLTSEVEEEARSFYLSTTWRDELHAWRRHRLTLIERRINTYPDDRSRLMPTLLGNVLRNIEDDLEGIEEGLRLQGYVIRNLQRFPAALLEEHDLYRNRLDMYAVMTFLTMGLAAFNGWALQMILPRQPVILVVTGLITLSFFSYRGAVASARDYGQVLSAMDGVIAHGSRQSAC